MVTIVRKSFPAVRGTVMRDFFQIIRDYGLYSEDLHSKTSSEYVINGNVVEFISLDQPQKIRGRKRDLLFINEANELNFEDWQQLIFRTTEQVVIDYNPSDEFHWIYDKVLTRDDCSFYKTTYKDNPFLDASTINEIERLKEVDEYYWQVYGLGQKAIIRGVVFSNWEVKAFDPNEIELKGYGMDFGFTNDPTTLIEVRMMDGQLWVRELIWRTGMTNQDIAQRIKELELQGEIVADSAEPKSIEELSRGGVLVRGATKGQDSIRAGIDLLRRYKINIHPSSENLIKEFKNYKYKQDKDGNYSNEPVGKFDHGIDSLRYFVFTNMNGSGYGDYQFI